jgi:hypothetical protein
MAILRTGVPRPRLSSLLRQGYQATARQDCHGNQAILEGPDFPARAALSGKVRLGISGARRFRLSYCFRAVLIVSGLKRCPQAVQITKLPVSSWSSRGEPILQLGQNTWTADMIHPRAMPTICAETLPNFYWRRGPTRSQFAFGTEVPVFCLISYFFCRSLDLWGFVLERSPAAEHFDAA